MGVTYKLSQDVVEFIVRQRQSKSTLSCRELSELVLAQFQVPISKSSVHEVLKEANIISPRGRKPKGEIFKIPAEKKAQIKAQLPPREVEPTVSLIPDPLIAQPEEVKEQPIALPAAAPLTQSEIAPSAGEIFLKAAFWDMRGEKVFRIHSYEELNSLEAKALELNWNYGAHMAAAIKLTFSDGRSCFVDPRLQRLTLKPSPEPYLFAPIENAIQVMADRILNNVEELVIGESLLNEEDFGVFSMAMKSENGLKLMFLDIVDDNAHSIVKYDSIVDFKRNFRIDSSAKVEFIKDSKILFEGLETIERRLRTRAQALFFEIEAPWDSILSLPGYTKSNKDILITHLIPSESAHASLLNQASNHLNALDIRDLRNRKIQVKID
jgi:hypothetical protein